MVGAEDALSEACVEECGIEAAVSDEVVQHRGPGDGVEALPECLASGFGSGRRDVGEGFEGLEDGEVAGMQDEVDGAAAALSGEMIVEPGAADAEDGARARPAYGVAAVAVISEGGSDALQVNAAERVGAQRAAIPHGPSSALAASTWSMSTLRALVAVAACSA